MLCKYNKNRVSSATILFGALYNYPAIQCLFRVPSITCIILFSDLRCFSASLASALRSQGQSINIFILLTNADHSYSVGNPNDTEFVTTFSSAQGRIFLEYLYSNQIKRRVRGKSSSYW